MDFPQLGVDLLVLAPGEPIGMYHLEADRTTSWSWPARRC